MTDLTPQERWWYEAGTGGAMKARPETKQHLKYRLSQAQDERDNQVARAEAAEAKVAELKAGRMRAINNLRPLADKLVKVEARLHQVTDALRGLIDEMDETWGAPHPTEDETWWTGLENARREGRATLAALAGEDDGQKLPQREGDYL